MYKKSLIGRALILVLVLTLFAIGVNAMSSRPVEENSKTITILQTSDIHGNIYPWAYKTDQKDDNIGLAKVYTIVKDVREDNGNTLLVDSGDMIQGTTLTNIFKDRDDVKHPMMNVMNLMGYDAWVLGNHEFNFGLNTLENIIADADFPVLSANIHYKNEDKLFVKPYTIKDIDGIKVAILGLTTPNIPRWDGDKVATLEFEDMSATAKRYIPEMNQKGADIIIALAHAGLEGEGHKTGGDKVRKVAAENPEITAIFAGHNHELVNQTINGVLIIAPEDKGHQVSRVDLTIAKKDGNWTVVNKKGTHLETKNVEAASEVLELAKDYHQETVNYVRTPIGEAVGDFTPQDEIKGIPAAQIQDTPLVDLINRIQLEATGADISAAALFDSNATIKAGPVSIKDTALIYKYPNTLYTVEISGKELKDYMEWTAAYFNTYRQGDLTISFDPEIRGYNYDMFAGINYKINISKPAGERITDLTFKGKPVKDNQTFTLALNNYRYGGLKASGILHNDPSFKSEKTIQQYIIDYIRENKTINPAVDNNWKIIGADLAHPQRDQVIELINAGIIEIPAKNRSWNAKSININDPEVQATLNKYKKIDILSTNDFHGNLRGGYEAGAAKFAAVINYYKKQNPKGTILVSGGDSYQGTPVSTLNHGAPVIELFNYLGYTASAIGNHEFDWGQDVLAEITQQADYKFVAANLYNKNTNQVVDYAKPYIITEVNGVKVGIIGISTPDTLTSTMPTHIANLEFRDPATIINKIAPQVKSAGANLIIVLSHMPGNTDWSTGEVSGELIEVAKKVKDINGMIGGHSHDTVTATINGIPVVEAYKHGRRIGHLSYFVNTDTNEVVAIKPTTHAVRKTKLNISLDKKAQAIVDKYQKAIEPIMSEILTTSKVALKRKYNDISNIGALVTDAVKEYTQADIVFQNAGGLRVDIPAGKVKVEQIYSLLPFGNTAVTAKMTGQQIIEILEQSFNLDKGMMQLSGLKVIYDSNKREYNRVVSVQLADGTPLQLDKKYKVATNNFLAVGGDKFSTFKEVEFTNSYKEIKEIVIEYLRAQDTINPRVDNRVLKENETVVEPAA
ncbi:2',3'-cyclic-nucleotide 2'-phosphodiesterase (5'-nucleotidase family) [Orenia metallireducens]|uniref:2',3'-cyclic-nucleotide 2'-phosphodiesterase/5'-or 3'-nucleotidase, 5'-nucleotidase family n=1 Tax=Orenia metallireducens TaxID=1413210 RepID=A0A285I7W0_9FIRM|nr:5'-nucleotidase C-terminal domain-containing protein [Orenia metallireducens]PRX22392.1 2',3'-cyclic-nucleotide 2'-phosphodiesterase (5'-nucleotidase family) [Orenia metallireducens]SNY44082.1 2',3'-cyclic-nucleotide 2'-phosphodiesterase/5'-or 3'-nucleotidase, 5'-nucleotidase family [Orenia metallireducens]